MKLFSRKKRNFLSFRHKVILRFLSSVMLSIIFCILMNTLVLQSYYLYKKRSSLRTMFAATNTAITSENSTEEILYKLTSTATNNNSNILVLSEGGALIYSTYPSFATHRISIGVMGILGNFRNLEKGEFVISNSTEDAFNMRSLTLGGKLDNGNIVLISSALEPISESVKISNEFLALSGIFALILFGIITYITALNITNPIMEMSSIAKKMTALDFSQKFDDKFHDSDDEISVLGRCLNSLSDNLEKKISELESANKKLEKDVERIKRVDEARKEFLSNASHELKTPITLIEGYSEALKDGVIVDEKNKEYYINTIYDEAIKMDRLVKELLCLDQLEFDNRSVRKYDFNLTECVSYIVKKFTVLSDKYGTVPQFDASETIIAHFDEFTVDTVVTNYLNNAFNHVDQNKIIKIYFEDIGNKIRLYVENSGKHIDEKEMKKIWQSFYKVDKSRSRDYGGSGLGLAIVKANARRFGTSCGAENTDIGVRFWFDVDK